MVRNWIAGVFVALGATLATVAAASPDQPDVAEAAPSDTGVTSIEVATSGNLRKQVGEPAGLTRPGSDHAHFEVVIDDIAVVRSCASRAIDAVERVPEHGFFVVVELTARMSDDVATTVPDGENLFMPLAADAFTVVANDGSITVQPLTDASWACFEGDVLAAPFVGPGESTSGLVVLDSAVDAGTLVYAPAGPGWEWDFGR